MWGFLASRFPFKALTQKSVRSASAQGDRSKDARCRTLSTPAAAIRRFFCLLNDPGAPDLKDSGSKSNF